MRRRGGGLPGPNAAVTNLSDRIVNAQSVLSSRWRRRWFGDLFPRFRNRIGKKLKMLSVKISWAEGD
jgi:hypothetical protein